MHLYQKRKSKKNRVKRISKFGSSECTDTILGLEKEFQKKRAIREQPNLRKSVYQGLIPSQKTQDARTDSKGNLQVSLVAEESKLKVLKSEELGEALPRGESIPEADDEQPRNELVRKSIISKHEYTILKNSMSCTEFQNCLLVDEEELDLDVSNLKGLKKKLAIIEEKETKQRNEKKVFNRKQKFRKKVKVAKKSQDSEKTQSSKARSKKPTGENSHEKETTQESATAKQSLTSNPRESDESREKVNLLVESNHAEWKSLEESEDADMHVLSKSDQTGPIGACSWSSRRTSTSTTQE